MFFNSTETCQSAIDRFNFVKVDNFELRLRGNPRVISNKHAPCTAINKQRVATDLAQAQSLAKLIDRERNIESALFDSSAFESISNPLKQLNIVISYLRHVHHYCYYCHTMYDDYDAIFNSCGSIHSRDAQEMTEEEEKFIF